MKKENIEEPKFLGPTGIKILKWAKMKPVGGRIPEEHADEWETYKQQCIIAKIKISDEGLLDMIMTNNKITQVLYPMALGYGYDPVEFKNTIIDSFLDVIQNINDEKWKKDSVEVRNEIIQGIEMAFSGKLVK